MEPKQSCSFRTHGLRDGAIRPHPTRSQPVDREKYRRRRIKRDKLGEEQASRNCNAERLSHFGAGPVAEGQGQRAKKGGHGCHDDWKKAQSRRLKDCLSRGQAASTLSIQRKIDHHDGVLHHDADNQYAADGGNAA